MRRIALFIASATVAGGCLLGSAGSAGAASAVGSADDPTVSFADSSVIQLGPHPVSVVLVNDTDVTWSIALSIVFYPDAPPPSATPSGTPSATIPVAPTSTTLSPHSATAVQVGPLPATATNSGTGFIIASAQSDGSSLTLRRPISVVAQPAVTKWSAVEYRWWPWGASAQGAFGPLVVTGGDCDGAATGTTYLTSDTTQVPVTYTCQVSKAGVARLRLSTSKVTRAGQYDGSLTVGTTAVSISLRRSTFWVWPVIVILIGFAVAAAQQAQVSFYRPLRVARRRLADLIAPDGLAATSQADFATKAFATSYAHYSMVAGVGRAVTDLDRRLAALRPPRKARRLVYCFVPYSTDNHDVEYQAVVKATTELEAMVRSWPGLVAELAKLAGRVTQVEANGSAALAEHLVEQARRMIDPHAPAVDVSEASALLADTPAMTAALALLPTAVQLQARLQSTVRHGASDDVVYEEATRKYRQAVHELALATSVQDVKKAGIDALLQDARALALQLQFADPHPALPAQAAQGALPAGAQGLIAGRMALGDPAGRAGVVSLVTRLPHLVRSIVGARRSLRVADFLWLFVALAIGTWSGLAALYIGKPWGLPADYFALAAWAFGTTAVLSPILSGLANLGSGSPPTTVLDAGATTDQAPR